MAVGIVSTSVDAVKFFNGDRMSMCVSAILAPGASSVSDDIMLEVWIVSLSSTKKRAFSLADMTFYDPSTGTYRTSFMVDGVPKKDVGILVAASIAGEREPARWTEVITGGNFIGNRVFDLTNKSFLMPNFSRLDKKVSVSATRLEYDNATQLVVGDFVVGSDYYIVENAFVRLFRKDMIEDGKLVERVEISDVAGGRAVHFADGQFVKKTHGIWGYKGVLAVKDSERVFLVNFIDRISWEVLTIKEIFDEIQATHSFEPVSATWVVEGSSVKPRYLVAREAILDLFESFESRFGRLSGIQQAVTLLGEKVVALDAISLFFELCFTLLEAVESRIDALPVLEMFPFEMPQELDSSDLVLP